MCSERSDCVSAEASAFKRSQFSDRRACSASSDCSSRRTELCLRCSCSCKHARKNLATSSLSSQIHQKTGSQDLSCSLVTDTEPVYEVHPSTIPLYCSLSHTHTTFCCELWLNNNDGGLRGGQSSYVDRGRLFKQGAVVVYKTSSADTPAVRSDTAMPTPSSSCERVGD